MSKVWISIQHSMREMVLGYFHRRQMRPTGLSFNHSSKTFPQLSHFQSSRLLDNLDFLQILQMLPRVIVSVVNSGRGCSFVLFLSHSSQNEVCWIYCSLLPTAISHDCEVERTIINGWMQNKCGKFMQISIRSHLLWGSAVVHVLFIQREHSFLAIGFLSSGDTFHLVDASAKWWAK